MDLKANQVVALKTQSLEPLGERADAFVDTLLAEGESTRDLVSQNIVALYGAGEVDGQFCAAMEYIQGNSIATMLERNEGFSIWGSARHHAPGLRRTGTRRRQRCDALFAGAGEDHGAVGWPGQDPRLWHLQHESDCSGVGQGPGPSVRELLLAGADSRGSGRPAGRICSPWA